MSIKLHTVGVLLAALCLAASEAKADNFAFNILAGNGSSLDHTSGTGNNARFFNPTGVAVDSFGNIYVADGGDHTVRMITPGGSVSTLAGSSGQAGNQDGNGSGALFDYPFALAVDTGGNVYVADAGNNNIRKITPSGSVGTIAGNSAVAGSLDGPAATARFNSPQGIAVDGAGNVYVSDTNNSTIRRISATGSVSTLAGSAGQTGSSDGSGGSARFNFPGGIAVDSLGNIYVADFDNSTIRMVTSSGSVSTVAGTASQTGTTNGSGGAALFDHPEAVAVDSSGHVYVIDTSNQTVRMLTTATGAVTTMAGSAGFLGKIDGASGTARFFYPLGIAANASGTVYIADTGNHSIRAVAGGNVSTLAGATGTSGYANGAGSAALFNYPDGVALDSSGNLYIADHNNNVVRKVTASGTVTTLAGTSGVVGSADGAAATATFNGPAGVAVDASGNVYVTDNGNNTVRKISNAGIVSTFASGFNSPQGLAIDSTGNLYVADTNNCTIREITSNGTVSTIAGAAGQVGSSDGAAGSARFSVPYAVTVDSAGNVYVADTGNATIRKISNGSVTTVAGVAGQANWADGNGTNARFNQPYAIAADNSGNVWVADTYNRAIRKVAPGGIVTTVNGSQARFYYPQGLAVDGSGNLYVVDGDNQAINKGIFVAPPQSGSPVGNQSVVSGQSAIFSVGSSANASSYQWQVSNNGGGSWSNVADGATYSGSATATLTVNSASASMNGYMYRAVLSNSGGSSTSGTGTLTISAATGPTGTARILNLSARAFVGTGSNILVAGFITNGTASKQILLRGVGPALSNFGLSGLLTTPQLSLYNSSSALMTTNTAWGGSSAMAATFASVGAFALPATSKDTAILQTLPAGGYTAQVSGVNNTTGLALAEIYDADSGNPASRLMNISARALVNTGANILTAGIIIGGSGTETVLIRGIGPTLGTQFGISGSLAAPQLVLVDANGNQLASNSGWANNATLSAAFAQVFAFSLPANSADAAMLVTLPSGGYTVQLSGVNNTTGVGLLEIYEIP